MDVVQLVVYAPFEYVEVDCELQGRFDISLEHLKLSVHTGIRSSTSRNADRKSEFQYVFDMLELGLTMKGIARLVKTAYGKLMLLILNCALERSKKWSWYDTLL